MEKSEYRIYINELAKILNRRSGTLRKWESDNRLPKHLSSKRDDKGWRYWTYQQVHGKNGIISWMKKNDIRPGRLMTAPADEARHVNHLRKPKYLSGYQIRGIKMMVANNRSREYILRKVFPRTKYSSIRKLETALVRLFKENDWAFPASINGGVKLTKNQRQEIQRLERKIESVLKQ